ncbi:MAG: hypothetical protein RLY14_2103 [Planctomycetota bacterium]|jgi:fructosamine-3-kinase
MERWSEAVCREVRKTTGRAYHGKPTRKLCSGGCIHSAEIWQFENGERFFIKSNRFDLRNMFHQEAFALDALRRANLLRIPEIYTLIEVPELNLCGLVLEAIAVSPPQPHHWLRFGQQLASLHLLNNETRYGWDSDNYIGATSQKNLWSTSWPEFFAQHRILYQVELLQARGTISPSLLNRLQKLIDDMPVLLRSHSALPSLIHGDLWSGNVLFDQQGQAVLIDPASYYGDREAEWGMIELFGGFPATFREGYQAVYPLPEGWQVRSRIYRLYHLLNHWNLFGDSYLSTCHQLLQEVGY